MKGSLLLRYFVGTALCILGALIVIAVGIAASTVQLPLVYVFAAVPLFLVGFSLQIHTVLKQKAESTKLDTEPRR